MRLRFDLHTHTFFSKDACHSPEEMIEAAVRRGLNGLAITDHDSCAAHDYLVGKKLPPDFLVVRGVEVGTAEGHLLCLGATLPRLKGRPAREVVDEIHKAGGLAVPAHPFDRWRAGIRADVLDTLDTGILEVFNAAVTSRHYNEAARDYATRRGWTGLAASDAHHASAVGIASTVFEMDELSLPALLAAIRRGGTPEGQYLSFQEGLKKHLANWFRIVNRRGVAARRAFEASGN
jgi:predicted metal-dependent phosphoesterase TrpH